MEKFNWINWLIIGAGIFALGAVGLYFYNPSQDFKKNNNYSEIEKKIGIDTFLKSDLSVLEKKDLTDILAEREKMKLEIKKILDEAYKNGKMEDAWLKVNLMREEMKKKLYPFIAEDKKGDFEVFCYKEAEEFDSYYIQK